MPWNDSLQGFFSPSTITVIGASVKNHWFGNLVHYCRRLGFQGNIYPVNPGAAEVCGLPAVSSIADLPEGLIDFAAVIVRSSLVLETVRALADRNIKNVLLVSSGFSEVEGDGERLQGELVALCRERGVRLMGPNCLGFLNVARGTGAFVGGSVEGEIIPGDIGIVGQSGATSEVLATKMLKKGLGISLFISSGNEAVISFEDCLEYMIGHGETRVVAGFIEGFRDGRRLKEIALEAARRRIPIVVLKVGRSEKGIQAARSHTGAIAGNEMVTGAFLRQYGIIRVETIEELVETAGILSRCPLPAGDGLAVCTLSGGLAGLYADLCASLGIRLPDLSPDSIVALKGALPPFARPGNPLDVTGSGFTTGMERVLRILLEDGNTDIIATLSFPPGPGTEEMLSAHNEYILSQLPSAGKPVIALTFREVSEYARKFYHDRGLYYIEHTRDGFKAIGNLIEYARFQRRFAKRIAGAESS
ncbi:MAG: acetate--CoA ligase family protein [Spirochaetes bacterium]|nr:acetate--CoA ligase family protein [Spirochaetota bacterium]